MKMEWLKGIQGLGLIAFTLICTVDDVKKREIRVSICVLFLILGMLLFRSSGSGLTELWKTTLPGLTLMIVSFLSKGAVGLGDALFLLVSAFYLSVQEICMTVVASWFFCAIAALFLIVFGNKRQRKRGLPYVGFMALPILCISVQKCLEVWQCR